MTDVDVREAIDLQARRLAVHAGRIYGLGLAFMFTLTLTMAFPDRYPIILLPEFLSGAVLPGLCARVLGWMEDIRQSTRVAPTGNRDE